MCDVRNCFNPAPYFEQDCNGQTVIVCTEHIDPKKATVPWSGI